MSVVLFKSVFHFCQKSDSHEGSQHKKTGLNTTIILVDLINYKVPESWFRRR
jgi:hypothetical protein